MSRSAEIEMFWVEADHTFRLGIKQLRQLQEKCGERGPKAILDALLSGTWLVDDVIQPIRLGLIGAGMNMEQAAKLVETNVEDRPLGESVMFAAAILSAAIAGAPVKDGKPVDPVEAPPDAEAGKPQTTAGSASPRSTEPARRSGSRPGKSTSSRSGSSRRR